MNRLFLLLLLLMSLSAPAQTAKKLYYVHRAHTPMVIDGKADDKEWRKADWIPLNQIWLGTHPANSDFQGRFKMMWDSTYLYVLAEIMDDSLDDRHADPLEKYWDDDCFEFFLDEDASEGEHQNNHNAWALHASLENNVVDIGRDGQARLYNDVCQAKRLTTGNTTLWELAIKVYKDDYVDGGSANVPVKLFAGKTMGFMAAYCDNDGSPERENFIGSHFIEGRNRNLGWITADVFGRCRLADRKF